VVLLVGGTSNLINAVVGLVLAVSAPQAKMSPLPCPAYARLGVGYSSKGRRIFLSLTVGENVMSGALGIPAKQAASNFEWFEKLLPPLSWRAVQPAER
jgi:branched-chain amino acid transport system ATP-binding protein